MVLFSENGRGLIEESAIHTDEFIFRAAAEFRQIHAGNFKRVKAREKHRRRHFQGGGTRKSSTGGKRGFVGCLESTGFAPHTGQHFGDSQRIIDPLTGFFETCSALDFSLMANTRTREADFAILEAATCGRDTKLEGG